MNDKTEMTFAECVAECARIMTNLINSVAEAFRNYMPYVRAELEHPKWVHMAIHHKKKRIRKKYHDRIMRTYGG